jgi:hypothetical protein
MFPLDRGPGGARRDRTDDLMLAKHALYQLSYGPKARASPGSIVRRQEVVGPGRLELPTLRLSGVRSNQLSYGPLGGAHNFGADPGARWARDHARAPKRRWARWKEKRRRRHPAPRLGVFERANRTS